MWILFQLCSIKTYAGRPIWAPHVWEKKSRFRAHLNAGSGPTVFGTIKIGMSEENSVDKNQQKAQICHVMEQELCFQKTTDSGCPYSSASPGSHSAALTWVHQNRASPFASDFYRRRGYRREFRSEGHFYPFSSQKKPRFASDFLRRGNRASWGLKKSLDFSGSGKSRRRNRRESRDFGALRPLLKWVFWGFLCRESVHVPIWAHFSKRSFVCIL